LAGQYLKSRGIDLNKIPESFYFASEPYRSEKTGVEFPAALAFIDSTETFINKRFIGELPANIAKSRNTGNMINKLYDKTFISGHKNVFLSEGVINALSIFQTGRSAMATFATSNEFDNYAILKKYLENKNIYLAYDFDKAGLIYAVKTLKFLFDYEKEINFNSIHIVLFPDSLDANDLLCNGTLHDFINDKYNWCRISKAEANRQYQLYTDARKEGQDYKPEFIRTYLYNLEAAKPEIKNQNCCLITTVCEQEAYTQQNTVGFNIENHEALFQIKSITKNLVYDDKLPYILDSNNQEPPIYDVFKKLVAGGFNLKVVSEHFYESDDEKTKTIGFVQFYTDELAASIPIGDNMAKTEAVKKAAEFLAMLDQSNYTVEYASVYKKFNLNKADWNTIARDYISKEKSKQIYSTLAEEQISIADLMDPNNLPHYVDRNEFFRRGYFAAQNKEGKEVLYMFKSKEDGMFAASNFTMKMIGHLYHNESNKNKRIIQITDEFGRDFYMEVPSSVIRSFNDFSGRVYEESNLFFFGSKRQYEMLLKNVSSNIPKWIELEVLGHNPDNFFAFADGIYVYKENTFNQVDDLGTIAYAGKTYYIPAFSSIYNHLNGSSDMFGSSKFLKYNKIKRGESFNHTTFTQWTSLMRNVYTEDNAGMFACIFVVMTAFRDFIHQQHRRFPLFFLSGPTNSGKSQVAESIQSPFAQGMQVYNLNSGTDASFFVSLEKFRNIPMIFDEYNDVQISKIKFQGLKAGYDGVGKQKKKDINSKELDVSEVNCSIVYLGQEIPEQDDYALFNRSLSFFIPLKDYTPEDTLFFDDLKKREEIGLTNILVEILKNRHLIEKHYYKVQIQIKDSLKKELQEGNYRYVERILNSVSEYLAVFKILVEHSNLIFDFCYADFLAACKEKCIKLSEMVQSANRLATFFQTITYLFNIGRLIKGREFKIEERTHITIRQTSNESHELALEGTVKVIFIRINLIFPMYREIHKNESLKTSLLGTYLKDSPAFLGNAINEDFEWLERKIISKENEVGNTYNTEAFVNSRIRNTTAIALDYSKLDLELEKISTDGGTGKTEDNISQIISPDDFDMNERDPVF
jgi:hypothetical protein